MTPESKTLKPSLVEWKRGRRAYVARAGKCLETFLGGMETLPIRKLCHLCESLKPSLVEWKLLRRA